MSQITRRGPDESESLRARSVAPPASRPGPTHRHQRRRDNVAEPLHVSWEPWQQEEVLPLKQTHVKTDGV